MAGAGVVAGLNPAEITHGQMFIGFFINVLLCGITITQVYLYGTTFKRDPQWLKVFVGVVFGADLMHTAFIFTYLYRSLITFYGIPEVLNGADWLFGTEPGLTAVIALAVQLFYAWRVQVLTKSWPLTGLIVALALAGGVGGLWTAVNVVRHPKFVEFQSFKGVVVLWLAAEALCDVFITTILVWYLRKHKTGFSHSDLVIDRIIRLSMQTGFLTTIVACLDMIFYLTDPRGTHLIFNFTLAKLYANSVLSSLNARQGWKFSEDGEVYKDGETLTSAGQSVSLNIKSQFGAASRPEIFVHVESHELVDRPRGKADEGNSVDGKKWSGNPYYAA